MYCSNCGSTIKNEAVFCSECGNRATPVQTSDSSSVESNVQETKPQHNTSKIEYTYESSQIVTAKEKVFATAKKRSIIITAICICASLFMVFTFSSSAKINRCLDKVFEETFDGYTSFDINLAIPRGEVFEVTGDVYVDGMSGYFKAILRDGSFNAEIFSLDAQYGTLGTSTILNGATPHIVTFWDDGNQLYGVINGNLSHYVN